MAGATGAARRTTCRWQKHAFAPSARFHPRTDRCHGGILPAQPHKRCPNQTGTAAETSAAGGDPVNASDPSGLYTVLRVLSHLTTPGGIYVAINQVTTGRGGNVLPGQVRVQFQISARSVFSKIVALAIAGSICDYDSDAPCSHDEATVPFQYTAHPSILAWPGDTLNFYGTSDLSGVWPG